MSRCMYLGVVCLNVAMLLLVSEIRGLPLNRGKPTIVKQWHVPVEPSNLRILAMPSGSIRSAQVRAYEDRAQCWNMGNPQKNLCPVVVCPYLCSSECFTGVVCYLLLIVCVCMVDCCCLCMCVYIYIYIHTYIHVCIYIYIYMCTHISYLCLYALAWSTSFRLTLGQARSAARGSRAMVNSWVLAAATSFTKTRNPKLNPKPKNSKTRSYLFSETRKPLNPKP